MNLIGHNAPKNGDNKNMPIEWLEEVLQTINGMCIDNLSYRKR
jgi:hypothetical protein